ncbi:unnamed protein product [Adineta steineri]|uniref:Methyltransferase domain-containing protein n=1 Tax=Adineta steineri TaxID=433720 RepID=A0A819HWQ7_9BILA|nr:unnamed protein product [Adineta steineri]
MFHKITKKLRRVVNNKIFIIFTIVIFLLIRFYFTTHESTPKLPESYIQSSDIDSKQCNLSLLESDGWFCESNSDWKRRKRIHRIQHKRNRISDDRYLFFQNNWEPTIHCQFERRIGNTGDGGKWICDVYRLRQMNATDLLIYSFGSNGDFSFEKAVKDILPKAEIHTFDMQLYECPDGICTFHQARLGNGKDDHSKSLQTVMKELGHENRHIQILKVDIEGSEYDLFENLFNLSPSNQAKLPYIRQILFEIHLHSDSIDKSIERTHELFELFRANNYVIFHKEVNLDDPRNVFEFAIIRLNAAFFTSQL